MWYFLLLYLGGFLGTLCFLKFFGKRLGFDYSGPHASDYDDYESNASAYTSFSVAWFILMPILLLIGAWKLLVFLARKFISD